jgi:hypothetical protein
MRETAGKNPRLLVAAAPGEHRIARSLRSDLVVAPATPSRCNNSSVASFPSASPRRDHDFSLRVLGLGIRSFGVWSLDPAVGGGRLPASRLAPLDPRPPSDQQITPPRNSARVERIFLVRVTFCHPRPLRRLPVRPGRHLGYRGGRRARSCPTRRATAD